MHCVPPPTPSLACVSWFVHCALLFPHFMSPNSIFICVFHSLVHPQHRQIILRWLQNILWDKRPICQHMPACTLPTIDWPWSGNAPHPPTWFSTILPFRQPVWLLLRFRCILWGLLCNCLFILTPKKSNMYLTPAAKWAKWRKLNTDSRHRRF